MGFDLMDNFRQPYFAVDIKDFWKRWHISLTSWFTDYLYIPLGGNRKGTLRKYVNILIVFGISGLWHGASWNFIVWGSIHAIYQICGDIKNKLYNKVGLTKKNQIMLSDKIRKAVVTFLLVDFAWIFFVANGLRHALGIISQMFVQFRATSIFKLGLNEGNRFILIIGILCLCIVDCFHERGKSVLAWLRIQVCWIRWIVYVLFIWSCIMFGIYGQAYDVSTFIYFQF